MNRNIGWAGLIVGVILVLLAVFASDLGLGGATYGAKHIVVLAVGVVLALGGLIMALRPSSTTV